jgi:hypothetical protein
MNFQPVVVVDIVVVVVVIEHRWKVKHRYQGFSNSPLSFSDTASPFNTFDFNDESRNGRGS